jgi:hypothetical protein
MGQRGTGADSWTVGGQDSATMGRMGDSHWCSVTMRRWQWQDGAMSQWDNGTMDNGTMGQWDNGTMGQWTVGQTGNTTIGQ